ncbi:MAG TPA: hypothetical protein VH092_27675 [Urbifossiella sp.]|jgi:hypothetical protein|nr:hypothetical protein [Urbifossiella sp.]
MSSTLLLAAAAAVGQPAPERVTFAEHIAPLVYAQCADCHRPGQVAPFPLLSYADARRHARTSLRVIRDREMPPWQPESGHGEFRGERRLTEAQIALFERWVAAGTPEGDPAQAPPPPTFRGGWQLGTPDLVVEMERPFAVPADGPDVYQNFVLPLKLTEDKWVAAVEFQSTAPVTVHHVLFFTDNSGRGRKDEERARAKSGQPGFPGMGFRPTGSLGGWAVGATPVRLPDGLALPLPKNADLVLQTHFHPSGKAASEKLTVGLYFAELPKGKLKPERTLHRLQLPPVFGLFSNVDIPAGKADFRVADSFTLPVDVDLVGAGAHAHYLGKTLKTSAALPDGGKRSLFSIRDWNFNWQGQYLYKDFVRLPRGTILHGEVTWDNSAANPRNPHTPPVRVRWGEASGDEMGSVSLMLVAANEADSDRLRTAIRLHTLEVLHASRQRGDRIDWDRLGIPVPPEWEPAPAAPARPAADRP